MSLKCYQQGALDALSSYLSSAKYTSPKRAFDQYVSENPTDRAPQKYHERWDFDHLPYVCLRVPTGGGKTLLAAHSVGIVRDCWLERDFPFVLWLVPSTTIANQTIDALRNTRHPYYQALGSTFDDKLKIFDISEINHIRPTDLQNSTCVVVSTIQNLRISDGKKDSRKVYGHNENLEPIFANIDQTKGLDLDEEGRVKFSFVNLLHVLRPLVIVDEAHKAISELTGQMIKRINPSCVLELTATPVKSNVLYRAFPSQLKAEEMVKLPFMLTEHTTWEQAIAGTVKTRVELEDLAQNDAAHNGGEYLRPIALIQAEKQYKDRDTITFEKIKQHLIEDENIPEEQIAIVTGNQRELDDIDLFDRDCKIRYIITVEALKEGWDCSFAYVFCSVANIRSGIDVEQLLGRVMRMPYAKRRQVPDLNKAYAHVISTRFAEAAAEMHEKLIEMGFHEDEARAYVQPQTQTLFDIEDTGVPGQNSLVFVTTDLTAAPDLAGIPDEERQRVTVEHKEDGSVAVSVSGSISTDLEKRILDATPHKQKSFVKDMIQTHRQVSTRQVFLTPSQQGEIFRFPQLCLELDGEMELAEPETVLGASNWSLVDFPAFLEEPDFRFDEKSETFSFDLNGEKMEWHRVDEEMETPFISQLRQTEWTEKELASWLDFKVHSTDISQEDLLEFIRRCLNHLQAHRGFDLPLLARAKYILAAALSRKIDGYRKKASQKSFQQLLFATDAKIETSFKYDFAFPPDAVNGNWPIYRGSYKFQKHFYPRVWALKSSGEEFDCAVLIDSHPNVEYWVRNIPLSGFGFWLPVSSTGRTYPDFVGKLKDGRCFAIEYKGEHLKDSPES